MLVRVLGPLTMDRSDELALRDRMILAALVVRTGGRVANDELAEALWDIALQQEEKKTLARIDAGEKIADIVGSTALIEKALIPR